MRVSSKVIRFDVIDGSVDYTQCVALDVEDADEAYINFVYNVALSAKNKLVYANMGFSTLRLEPAGTMADLCPGSLFGIFTISIPRSRLIKAFMKVGWGTPLHVEVKVAPYGFNIVVLYKDGHWEEDRDLSSEMYVDDYLSLSDIEPRWWEWVRIALGRLMYMIHRGSFKEVYELTGWSQ